MSFESSYWAWKIKGVSPLQKLILMKFADSFGCGDGSLNWSKLVSIKNISVFVCHDHFPDIRNALRDLEKRKLLFVRGCMFYLPVEGKTPPPFPPPEPVLYGLPRMNLFRNRIFIRDRCSCRYCGREIKDNGFHLDHVYPKSRGGKRTYENMVTSCSRCNHKKHARTPEEAKMSLLPIPGN